MTTFPALCFDQAIPMPLLPHQPPASKNHHHVTPEKRTTTLLSNPLPHSTHTFTPQLSQSKATTTTHSARNLEMDSDTAFTHHTMKNPSHQLARDSIRSTPVQLTIRLTYLA